jgi:hypothetical protein
MWKKVDTIGSLPFQAAMRGRANVIELLLSSKADINPKDRCVFKRNSYECF